MIQLYRLVLIFLKWLFWKQDMKMCSPFQSGNTEIWWYIFFLWIGILGIKTSCRFQSSSYSTCGLHTARIYVNYIIIIGQITWLYHVLKILLYEVFIMFENASIRLTVFYELTWALICGPHHENLEVWKDFDYKIMTDKTVSWQRIKIRKRPWHL